MKQFAAWPVMALGLFACKPKSDEVGAAASAPPSAAVSAPVATPSASAAAATVVKAGLPEEDAKRFVARWEAAQNTHDFADYGRLYAERFMGVKRVGGYSKRFDRAAWLVDRKPMVEGSAQVRVTDLVLVPSAGATRAIFTQEFTSTGFRDVGKKELFLVASPGGIVISREEMLSSEVGASSPSDESVLAYDRDGAVIQRGFDETALKNRPRLLWPKGTSTVEIDYDAPVEALSASSRAWLGREVTAYSVSGQACSGRVARFEVRVRAVPHFGMIKTWNGEMDEPKSTPEQVAKSIATTAQSEEHYVVGVLDKPCAGTWATAGAQAFVKAESAAGKLRESALSAFKALPQYAELQRRFVKESGDAAHAWEAVDGLLRVVEIRAASRPALLVVSARGGVGCGGFIGSLSAAWENTGRADAPKLSPVAKTFSEFSTLHGALDQGAAGLALLAGPDDYDDQVAVLRPAAAKTPRRVLLSTAFWDCGC